MEHPLDNYKDRFSNVDKKARQTMHGPIHQLVDEIQHAWPNDTRPFGEYLGRIARLAPGDAHQAASIARKIFKEIQEQDAVRNPGALFFYRLDAHRDKK